MKNIALFLALFCCIISSSQENDSIQEVTFERFEDKKPYKRKLKETDTIYLVFNHKKYQTFGVSSKKQDIPFQYIYIYYLGLNSILDINNNIYISVFADGRLNFEKKADIKHIDKKFLKKHKKYVYDIKRMRKMGFKNFVNEIGFCTVYLIDTKKKDKKKLIAREVFIFYEAEL